ncbi:MAG: stage V sporulation protein T [Clostridia bacterium]|nr:stage V sporulation protein T [Clostridia bacterium]
MKATGIVRRIDELGRVVIPKEIRRTLRIREGDPLEIFTDKDGEIILKKYSPIGELGDFAREYAEALYASFGHTAVICDKDCVIAASGAGKKDYIDKSLSLELEAVMQNREKLLLQNGNKALRITADERDEVPYSAQVIVPILANGDAIGAVMLLSRDASIAMGKTEMKSCETAANFMGKQLEC